MLAALLIGLAAGFLANAHRRRLHLCAAHDAFHPELGLHGTMATSAGFAVCAGLALSEPPACRPAGTARRSWPATARRPARPAPESAAARKVLAVAFTVMVVLPYLIRLPVSTQARLPLLLISGLIIGAASSLLGLGGGLLIMPIKALARNGAQSRPRPSS